ncbi:MAG: hypothetical protein JNL74_02120 [Fibrobacteres bacterium]|nr:hypothetical protein [Fibrobacterota bacterium]
MNKLYQLLCLILLLILHCEKRGDDIAGTVTETNNPGLIHGLVTNSDGLPVPNALVRFVSRDWDPGTGSSISLKAYDSCYTNRNGYYFTNNLTNGTWNVLAANSGNSVKAFVDSLLFTGETLAVDTAALNTPGSIRGSVRMQRGDDPRMVSVYVIGALAYSMVDSTGGFSFGSMAKGQYRLRFRAYDPKYAIYDTIVTIASGVNKIIDSPIVMPLRIPTPTGFKLTYDTLKQFVTLQWDAMNPLKVAGYNIYRRQVDSSARKLNAIPYKAGTVFVDSTAVQDLRYVYSIASVDSLDNEGSIKATWKDTVTIKPAFKFVSTFGGRGTDDGKFNEIYDIISLSDGRLLVIDIGTHTIQIYDTLNNLSTKWGGLGTGNGEFDMPISAATDDSGYIYILEYRGSGRIQKFDLSGSFVKSWSCGLFYTQITYDSNKIYAVGDAHEHIRIVNLISSEVVDMPLNNMSFSKIEYLKSRNAFIMTHASYNKVVLVNANGTLISSWGQTGTSNAKFQEAGSISISKNNDVYIADMVNGRFQVFSETGSFLMKTYLPISEECAACSSADFEPTGITLNKAGNVLVSDRYYIMKFIRQ